MSLNEKFELCGHSEQQFPFSLKFRACAFLDTNSPSIVGRLPQLMQPQWKAITLLSEPALKPLSLTVSLFLPHYPPISSTLSPYYEWQLVIGV